MQPLKIAIIGAGFIGSTTAYALLLEKIAAEIILIDINEVRCHGEILDLPDAISFDNPCHITSGTSKDAAQADIIIIAAGTAQKPGQTRLELLTANKPIISDIFEIIKPINPQAIIIMVTNPLDQLTAVAQSLSGLPRNQVFGTGTFLDTLRLRVLIANKLQIAPESINAYVIGEHGDSQCAVWSSAEIAGTPLAQFPGIKKEDFELMAQEVKNKAYEIISCKGATYFGIATCIAKICTTIISDQKTIIPLSTYIPEYDCCISMPAILGKNGIEKTVPIPLNTEEQKKLIDSAQQLRNTNTIE